MRCCPYSSRRSCKVHAKGQLEPTRHRMKLVIESLEPSQRILYSERLPGYNEERFSVLPDVSVLYAEQVTVRKSTWAQTSDPALDRSILQDMMLGIFNTPIFLVSVSAIWIYLYNVAVCEPGRNARLVSTHRSRAPSMVHGLVTQVYSTRRQISCRVHALDIVPRHNVSSPS